MLQKRISQSVVLVALAMLCALLPSMATASAQDAEPASISGRLFLDLNGNETEDPDEPGLLYSTIYLFLDDDVVAQFTPNSSGAFRFDDLAPGSYWLQFAGAWGNEDPIWIPAAGDRPSTRGLRKTSPVELEAGQDLIFNAGAVANAARIQGQAFLDVNFNDTGEAPDQIITGLPVRIRDQSDAIVWEGVTNSYGWYARNVDPGGYFVEFDTANGWVFVRQGVVGEGIASDVDPTTGRSDLLSSTRSTYRRVDAGLRVPPEQPAIGLAQTVEHPIKTVGDELTVRFRYVIANIGQTNLADTRLVPDLEATFGSATVQSIEPIARCATAALAGTLALDPQQSCEATVEVVVTGYETNTTYLSSAAVAGVAPNGAIASDVSDDGDIVDPDGDGQANGEGEDDPSPIVVPFADGDVDCNGFTDIVDALRIARFDVDVIDAVGNCPTNPTELFAARGDLNADGAVDAIDALFIAQCSALIVNPYCDRMNLRP